ncbi:MAG: asparagine synthase (glutamine-hydrolyzing) [Polyangiaceae bacterium]|nr:asparagine synthase (glutamine-hydrolyzing) [Polyangiaceae bacterium]
MCGVTGIWTRRLDRSETLRAAGRMTDQLAHRGPDGSGAWVSSDGSVALGHRRLSIVDLSDEGRQPMVSASGRFVLSFNGEVYNFAPLRAELEASGRAPVFRGHSDTEVVLAAIEAWGLRAAVERFIGMFALAVWDNAERQLHLVRDRLGIKPLYYGELPGGIVVASELKALTCLPEFSRRLDRDALDGYMQFAYVPAPRSIYADARKVRPGTILSFAAPDRSSVREVAFWSVEDVARRGLAERASDNEHQLLERLEQLLLDAVRLRLVADVPLGAFLSGGVDSSTVVALMQSLSSRPVRTFSIGNESSYYDESKSAEAVAAHLGCEHTTLLVTGDAARSVVPKLPELYDEPFADSSQIPTYLVSELARRHVTVALSGDGGDELLGGYNRHVVMPWVWAAMRGTPRALRRTAARAIGGRSLAAWDATFTRLGPLGRLVRRPGPQVHKLASVLQADSPSDLYRRLATFWPPHFVKGANTAAELQLPLDTADVRSRIILRDLQTYLPDDILTKVDRASMGVSLEARVPLLDHRLIEFAWQLPASFKVRRGTGKWALRQILHRYVPPALVERPKMGFVIPLGEWLRGPLRDWAADLLMARRAELDGFIDMRAVDEAWQEHLRGDRDLSQRLWTILIFEQWRRCHAPTG